jgi:PAS domain S-box-containing protein
MVPSNPPMNMPRGLSRMGPRESERLRYHGIALALVLGAALTRMMLGLDDPALTLALSGVVVALSAAVAGFAPGIVAALAWALLVRLTTPVALTTALIFAGQGFLIALIVSRLSSRVDDRNQHLADADERIRGLLAAERRLQAIDTASRNLEAAAGDYAVVILDRRGRITEWRGGGERLYGWRAEQMIGQRASTLLAVAEPDSVLTRLLGNTSGGASATFSGSQRRADGTEFEADLELRELGEHGRDGFVILVRDRTRELAWQAFAASAAEAQNALRDEADVAHRQLATLQHVTDPSVNTLSASQAAIALLDRLRDAIDADGVGLIRTGAFRRRILSVNERLQDENVSERRQNDARTPQDDRIIVIQNDPARVASMSLVNWPESVSSLIAVPIVAGGVVEGTIEVVGLKSRRSTEWEIALVQVVAARIAGRLQDESYLDADAVA